jgi:hypothetical protein
LQKVNISYSLWGHLTSTLTSQTWQDVSVTAHLQISRAVPKGGKG